MHSNSPPSGTPMAEQSQNNIATEFVNITIPESLLQVLRGKPPRRSHSLGRQMQKVPTLLRLENNNQQAYDPLLVSFGPYHHGKPELQAAEDFKLKALEMLVADSGKDVPFYYTKVLELVNDARNCYLEDSTYAFDDPTFAQMMLLDACFIIHFIVSPKIKGHIDITHSCLGDFVSAIVIRDMFLLENQIPFWVLKLIICWGYGKDEGEKLLNEFLADIIYGEYRSIEIASSEKEQPFHLLDAFWLIIVSECRSKVNPISKPGPTPSFRWLKQIGNALGKCSHLQRNCCILGKGKNDDEFSAMKYVHSFRSATDLKSKGIHFKPSCADSLMGISFKSGYFFAQLEVPICFVSVYTKVFFLNMIAYEVCPKNRPSGEVTAYIDFMKSLIDSPKDVKELREKKILLTTLGSDEDVAKVYSEIKTYGLDNVCLFHNVKEEIQAHYNNRAKTWLAELLHTYFRSPWKVIGLLAATFLLVLTFLQTYFTVKPSSG